MTVVITHARDRGSSFGGVAVTSLAVLMAGTRFTAGTRNARAPGVPVGIGLPVANGFEAESILSNQRLQAAET